MKLATFDIFDTTLIRRCGHRGAVPYLVAERLWPGNSMRHTEYVNLRRQAAAACHAGASIHDIYAYPGFSRFPEYSAREIMKAEMEVESEMLTVNPVILRDINELRRRGWTIKFLSDMYLDAEFLADVLRREGCLEPGEEVIVSCQWCARKDTGTLYRRVREKFNPAEWQHFGDNRHSDLKMARKNGVKAHLVDFGYTPVEKRLNLLVNSRADGWKMWLLTGASRTARIKASDSSEATLATDYIAPLYVPFVLWVLNSSRARGIKRLHFLSRDGYIMQQIALASGFDDIEFNYLFVSRKALMRAYLSNDSARRFIEISDRQSLITQHVDHLLKRLQLDRTSLSSQYGIEFDYSRIINKAQQQDFLDKIFNNERLTPKLMREFSRDSHLTVEYLRQQHLADDTPQAMIDIGWLGTSRLTINSILDTNIPTYYVGVRADVYDRSCGDFDSFFPTGRLDTAATGLIENYFSASPWPSTIGYQRDADGSVAPRFADGEQFTDTEITRVNREASCAVMTLLHPYLPLLDSSLLWQWAATTIDYLSNLSGKVDLTPMLSGAAFDDIPMVTRLNPLQILNFTLCGGRYTAFDRGSVDLTLGSAIGKLAWRMHTRTARLRRRLFKLMLKLKNR